MAQQQKETLSSIREYTKEAHELQDGAMDVDPSNTESRLEQTVKELQARVQEQQAALEKVRTCSFDEITSTNACTAKNPVKYQP